MADESCVTMEDIERVPGRFAGFNIKLVKCGGLTPALRMARRGRELGLRTMVGCMLESSLLIAAGSSGGAADGLCGPGRRMAAGGRSRHRVGRFDAGCFLRRERMGLGVVL